MAPEPKERHPWNKGLPATTDSLIFDDLSPRDIISWSWTCRAMQYSVQDYQRRAFSYEKVLSRFFSPEELLTFRSVQAATGTVISGSTALQFFERTVWDTSDLDLYVEHRHVQPMADFLESIGYVFVPRAKQKKKLKSSIEAVTESIDDPYRDWQSYSDAVDGRGFAGVYDMYKGGGVKIQIITARDTPLDVIMNYHSTCVMQIITYSHAYSLYPRATFEERLSLLCFINGKLKQDIARQKYVDRGWTMVDPRGTKVWYPEYEHATETTEVVDHPARWMSGAVDQVRMASFHFTFPRRLGDRFCWTIPLPPLPSSEALQHTSLPLFEGGLGVRFIESNSWVLLDHTDGHESGAIREASHIYCLAESPSCRFRYCLAPFENLKEVLHASQTTRPIPTLTFPTLAVWKDATLEEITTECVYRDEFRFSRFIQRWLETLPHDILLSNPAIELKI